MGFYRGNSAEQTRGKEQERWSNGQHESVAVDRNHWQEAVCSWCGPGDDVKQ